jgi:hypothetical protein
MPQGALIAMFLCQAVTGTGMLLFKRASLPAWG